MYVSLLKNFTKFKEFHHDWTDMSVKNLKHYFQSVLSSSLVHDIVILLNDVPNKNQKNFDDIISNIALLAGIVYDTWVELEKSNELIGQVSLVLESSTKLDILNTVKDEARLILYVEPLFD